EDEFTKGGFMMSHYLSIASSGENSTNNFSVGYDSNSGNIIYYRGFERITSSFNTAVQVNDRFNYGLNVTGSYIERDNPRDRYNAQNPFWSILRNSPYQRVYFYDSEGNVELDAYGDPKFNQAPNQFGYSYLDEAKYSDTEYRNFRLFGSGFLALEIFDNVTARTSFGATYDRAQSESFLQPRADLNTRIGNPGGTKWDNSTDRLDYNWRNEVTYANNWGKHNLAVTAASEYINENLYNIYLTSSGYPNNVQNVQSLAQLIGAGSETVRWKITRFGYLGTLGYNFDDKYFIDGYVRRDGTSLAGFNSQYGTFWGVSLGW